MPSRFMLTKKQVRRETSGVRQDARCPGISAAFIFHFSRLTFTSYSCLDRSLIAVKKIPASEAGIALIKIEKIR